jgi:excisionase family DNA binding protein
MTQPFKGNIMKSKTAPTNTRLMIKPEKSEAEKPVGDEASYGLAELLTAKDLEALLKIDQKTIYRYVAAGSIPYVRIQSNIRFVRRQILRWIENQSFLPKSFDKT